MFNIYIFQLCQATRQQADSPYHVIQKYLILEDISGFVNAAHSWVVGSPGEEEDTYGTITNIHPQLLRFLAHIILLLKAIGVAMNVR